MNQSSLLRARFIAPGVVIVLFTALFGYATGVFTLAVPSLGNGLYAISFLLPAFLYYATPFRRWINALHHRRIAEHNRQRLVAISSLQDDPSKMKWAKLRPIFYELIDEDKSLGTKAERARANGFVWTTFADATGIAFFFAIISLVAYSIIRGTGYLNSFVLFALIVAFGIWGSIWTTREQIRIADEQLDVMELKYRNRVSDWISKVS